MALISSPISLATEILPQDIPAPPELPEDTKALELVVKDLNRAEYYTLARGMTVEWDRDDRLYLFRMPVAFWEGSSVPRSSLGIPLIFEHIESLMPQFMQALFSDDPPFLCNPRATTTGEAARAVSQLISKQLKDICFKEETRLGLKEALTYGTGVWKAGWKREKKTRRTYKLAGQPEAQPIGHGKTINAATEESRKTVEMLEEYEVNTPCIEKVHIRHILVSPDLRVPDIRKAKYVIHRMYLTLDELEKLRDQPGYKMPSNEYLRSLFEPPKESPERSLLEGRSTTSVLNTGVSSLDINMEFKAMPRWQNASEDPNLQVLEVVEYTTPDRIIVVLNRKLCIKNDINAFGCINYFSTPFVDVLDSWYGIGIAKLLSGEQRLQQGVINSRLDDLALRLSGTFLRKRGANTPTQQLRLRPGGIIDSDDDKGVQMINYPPAIADAFTEVEASDSRAQRRSGANDIVTQGQMSHPSSIGRTSFGMQTLAAGVGARSGYFIDCVVDYFFIPFLQFVHECNSRWLSVEEIRSVLGEEAEKAFTGNALEVKNANVKFQMLSGSKMRAKMAMQQQLMPMMQLLSAAPVLESIQDQDKKIQWMEFVQQFFDVTDWPGRQSLIVDQTPEDKQKMAQKNEMMQQMSLVNQKHQATMAEIDQKGLAQSGTHVIRALLDELTTNPDHKIALLQTLHEMQQSAIENGQQQQQGPQGQDQNDPLGIMGGGGTPNG